MSLQVGRKKYTTVCGTPEYLAPEILQNQPYGKSVDFWNFGCLLFELLTGHSPFHMSEPDLKKLTAKILNSEFDMPDYVPPEANDLISQLLNKDPKTRLGTQGVDQIKAHPFFKTVNWEEVLRNHKKGPLVVKNLRDEIKMRALNVHFDEKAEQATDLSIELSDFSYTEGLRQ